MPKMPLKTALPDNKMEAFRLELLKFLNEHSGDLPADVMLALAAYAVGQLIAMQDQTRFTHELVMALVSQNIQAGNTHAIESFKNQPTSGSA
ncbi:hypothetical protein [Roseibium album]|uniref:hypothetical protein n=1 Tax=Roseibium album TaxID=311410 RepID=UPI0024937404|nr:hypothetical protein [Roseibium album]